MVDKFHTNSEDAVVLFKADEYRALLSLLYELSEPEKLLAIVANHDLAISKAQIARIAGMWHALTQNKAR